METSTAKQSSSPHQAAHAMPRLPWRWRLTLWMGLVLLLSLGFAGYFLPGIRLNWETIAAMCGF